VLDYEQWKGPHKPFDPERHILQVVAVDHITQAADIALIDDRTLAQIEASLVPHGRLVAERISALSETDRLHFNVVYVKGLWEMASRGLQDGFWVDSGAYFLVRPSARQDLAERFPALEAQQRLWNFDPREQVVTDTIREMVKHYQTHGGDRFGCALIAPFFFLKRDLNTLSGFSLGPAFERFRLFGNNYAIQGFKVKRCKPVLNRVFSYLSLLSDEDLNACPFLSKWSDIYVMNLSFIPEPLRLDASRAARILENSLKKWLATVEGKEREAEESSLLELLDR